MVTMIKSRAGQGKSNEMLRRFMCGSRDAVYISNEINRETVYRKMARLRDCCGVSDVSIGNKTVITLNKNAKIDDYFRLIRLNKDKVLYLDLLIDMEEREAIKAFCYNVSLKYRDDIHMTEQLRANSFIDGVIIVREE